MTSQRLSQGGLIDRSAKLTFRFDGKDYAGHAGDTITSALLANDVRVLGRSFKYHRPRGAWGAWIDDPNAIMNVSLDGRDMPNCPAAATYLSDGMYARAVNAWPSARTDVKGVLDLFHRWLGAGFYYKTFMWPDWHLFEPAIRKMAGLGAVEGTALEDFTPDQTHMACARLVVGGGVAGLTAARAAAETGHDVIVVDDHDVLGGGIYRRGAALDGQPPEHWVAEQKAAIEAAGGRVLTQTTAFGIYDHGLVALVEQRGFAQAPRLWRVRAEHVILATGALDRPITFANNDLPGVLSAQAALEYLGRFGVLVGKKIGLASAQPDAEAISARLQDAGATVQFFDPTQETITALGRKQVAAIRYGNTRFDLDALLVSGGATPLVHLWRHAGGRLTWSDAHQAFLPGDGPAGLSAIGAAAGIYDLDAAREHASKCGRDEPAELPHLQMPMVAQWPKPGATGRQWIDFQHDVTLKDVELAARENYVSVEHLKRYTTMGMASDQGKTSNMAGLAAMAAIQNRPIPEVGTTTFRPPFVPVPLGLYHGTGRGALFHPLKRLPLEAEHRAAKAALSEYGGWLRPAWYPSAVGASAQDCIQSEALRARHTVGIFDASPLGKIEVMGPDAEAFINFVYYNTISTLKPGHIRYGFMLTEQGVIYDDGVVARIDAHRFIVSCSSSHVDGVRQMLESWRQDGNDPDRIFIHDTTQNWATVAITGPKARDVVASLELGIDLSASDFGHMQWREGRFDEAQARVARVSFTGDLSFEVTVPTTQARSLWQAAMAAATAMDGGPLGIEALSILRAEKGYIMVGKDTDGMTMPHDLGFGVPRQRKARPFVGDRGVLSPASEDPNRRQLVGLDVVGADPLVTGAHVLSDPASTRTEGIVTSSYFSPTLNRPIALALIERGSERIGETLHIWHMGESRLARIADACAFDKNGERLHA